MSCILYNKSSYAHLIQSQLLHNAVEKVFNRNCSQAEIVNWLFTLNVAAYCNRYSIKADSDEITACATDDLPDSEFPAEDGALEDPDIMLATLKRISYQCADINQSDINQVARYAQLEAILQAVQDSDSPEAERLRLKAQQDKAKAEYDTAYAAALAGLRARYPWAIAASPELSGPARAAKNLKKELALAFPGVKFSVRSSRYSGGNSIDVGWPLGPTSDAVAAVAGKYQSGSFDGMTDCYENDRSAFSSAVGVVLGLSKYVSCQRDYPDGLLEQGCRDIAALHKIEFEAVYQRVDPHGSTDLRDLFYNAMRRCSWPEGATYAGVKWCAELEELGSCAGNETIDLVLSIPAVAEAAPVVTAPNISPVTVTENDEHNGVEIRFAAKPDRATLDILKAHGFRWSMRHQLWFAKRTNERLAFAISLTGENPPAITDEEAEEAYQEMRQDEIPALHFAPMFCC